MAALRLQPCKVWLNRDDDMVMTENAIPAVPTMKLVSMTRSRITAFTADLWMDAGYARDLSGAVLDRAMFHLDNSCFIEKPRFLWPFGSNQQGQQYRLQGLWRPPGHGGDRNRSR